VNIAVTGGTGFVGRHLVNRLVEHNHQITVLTHRNSGRNLFGKKVQFCSGSVENTADMVRAFENAEIVFHLVGIIAETKTKSFDKTVSKGTTNVVNACQQAGVKKIIYVSALGTSSEAKGGYMRAKYEAEESVKSSGLKWTILRPSIIYGNQDGFLTLLAKLVKLSPVIPIFGDGKYELQLVHINDLTKAMSKIVEMPETDGETIDIVGPEKLDYVTVVYEIKKALKKKRLNIHIPFGVITPIAVLLEKLLKPAPLTRDQLLMLKQGSTGNIVKMRELLGIEPVKFENGLKLVFGDSTDG
jgi:uncharacterized protein YbjT (DUF2867 family)